MSKPRRSSREAVARSELHAVRPQPAAAGPSLEEMVHRTLVLLGEDPERQGLVRTPERVAESLQWLTRGYGQSVQDLVHGAVFEEQHENMVLVRDIELYSLCEHHMLPFFGKA